MEKAFLSWKSLVVVIGVHIYNMCAILYRSLGINAAGVACRHAHRVAIHQLSLVFRQLFGLFFVHVAVECMALFFRQQHATCIYTRRKSLFARGYIRLSKHLYAIQNPVLWNFQTGVYPLLFSSWCVDNIVCVAGKGRGRNIFCLERNSPGEVLLSVQALVSQNLTALR